MNAKRIYNFILALLLLMMVFYSAILLNKTIPATSFGAVSSAKAMTVMEANSKRLLLEKNKDVELPMASITKIMTALVSIENIEDINQVVDIDKRAVGIEGTSIYLTENEHLTAKELLYGLMLASGNDASMALASYVGKGDIDYFIDLMNNRAKELGANNTNFVNPHGLDIKNHYTTAYDLALITSEAMKNPVFRDIVSTKRVTISGNDKVKARYLKNKQRLLHNYADCIGVKTGFTDNAGRCSVSAVERNDMLVICVVLNCPDMFEESARLLDEVFSKFSMEEILPQFNVITEINVTGGTKDGVFAFSQKEFKYPLTETEKSFIIISNNLPENLTAPVDINEKIGTVYVKFNDEIIFEEDILTMDSVEKEKIEGELEEIINNWALN